LAFRDYITPQAQAGKEQQQVDQDDHDRGVRGDVDNEVCAGISNADNRGFAISVADYIFWPDI
jgi:hypothetical protein